MGRDEQLERERDENHSRQETAREMTDQEEPAERSPDEAEAEVELLKTSGGDPFTQESD